MTVAVYRAKWVLPVASPAIEGGYVVVQDGRIAEVSRRSCGSAVDLGNVAIVPGFVNAHMHLDLSGFPRSPQRPKSFLDWLLEVIAYRRSIGRRFDVISAELGRLAATGTTLVGDIASSTQSMLECRCETLPAVSFREVVGLNSERFEPLWTAALADVETKPDDAGCIAIGLSPHAPYSTALEIYHRAAAVRSSIPLATHWFECQEELQFLLSGQGPMRDFLEGLGALAARSPQCWSKTTDILDGYLSHPSDSRWLLIHGNFLSTDDIAFMASGRRRERIAGVVYCPRTHAYFGRPPHPWRQLQKAGIRVALGTDSLASNPDLCVFNEARFLSAQACAENPVLLLEMITLAAADLLGAAGSHGSLCTGKRADMAVVSAPFHQCADSWSAIFDPAATIVGTILGGKWIWKSQAHFAGDVD